MPIVGHEGNHTPHMSMNLHEGHAAGAFVCIVKFDQISTCNSFIHFIIYFIVNCFLSIVLISKIVGQRNIVGHLFPECPFKPNSLGTSLSEILAGFFQVLPGCKNNSSRILSFRMCKVC